MNNKVGIIGAGHVGSHCAYAMLNREYVTKLFFMMLINRELFLRL